jgi:hypothetical protein
MQNCLVCLEDEVDAMAATKVYEEFKAHTARNTYDIEFKGGAKYSIPNTIRVILTTNNIKTFKMDKDERRILAIKISGELVGNLGYWAKFNEFLADAALMRRTFDYFKTLPLKPPSYFRKLPETSYSKVLKDMSKDPVESWLMEEGEEFLMKDNNEYGSQELWKLYKSWIEGREGKAIGNNAFTGLMQVNDVASRLFKWSRKAGKSFFTINRQQMKEFIGGNNCCYIEDDEDSQDLPEKEL